LIFCSVKSNSAYNSPLPTGALYKGSSLSFKKTLSMIKMIGISKSERVVEIGWEKVTLEEAVYLMGSHDGECHIDGDNRTVVLTE